MAINPNFVPTLEPINNYTSDRIINTDKVIVEGTPSTGLVSFDKILGGKDDVALKYHYTNSPSPTSPTSSDTRYVNITNLKRTSPRILEGNDTDGNKVIIKEVTLSGTTTVKVYINGNVVENSLSSLGSRTVSLVSNTAKLLEGSATSTSGETSYPYYSISPRELYALTVLEVLLNKENDIFSKTNSYINALIDKAFNIARLFYGKAVICRVYDGLGTGSVVPYDLLPVANHTATNMLATCEFIYTPISGITPELSWVIFDSILGLNDTVAIRYFYDDLVSSANDVIIYDTISNLKRVSPRILEGVNTNGEVITIKESTCTISDVVVPCISVLKNGELYFNLVGNLDVAHPTKSYPETTDPLVATKTYLLSLLTIGLDLAQDDSSTTLSYKDTSPRERYTIVALKSLLELEDNILDKSNAYLNGLVDKAFLISRAFLGKARMSRLDIDGLPGNAEVKDVRLVTSGNPSIVNSDGIALIPTASSTHNYGLVAIDNNTITLNSSGLILANGGGSGTITDVRVNNASVVPSGSTIANIPLASTSNHGAMSSSDKTKLNNIESGAEVNVLSDWNLTNTSSDDYIKNKPTIPTVSIDTDDYYITVNGTSIGTEDAPIGWAWEALLAYKDEDGNFIKDTYQTKISSSNKIAASNISGLSTVATSGSYNDLSNKPTNLVTTNTTQTISGTKSFTSNDNHTSGHYYHNWYSSGNSSIYEHYYPSTCRESSNADYNKTSLAILRVWDGTNHSIKAFVIGGNGELSWNGNNVLTVGNYNNYVPKTDGTGANGTWGINISGNAAKLGNSTIGSVDTPIYLSNGIPLAITSIGTNTIKYGGSVLQDNISPFDMGLESSFGANRFAAFDPDLITVERYSDGAWSTVTISNSHLTALVRKTDANITLVESGTTVTTDNKLRITFDAVAGRIFFNWLHCLIRISTNGCTPTVKIEGAKIGSETTFETIKETPINGWSGWNSIPISLNGITVGEFATAARTDHYKYIRFTFSLSRISSGNTNNLAIYSIHGFGSLLAIDNHYLDTYGVPYYMDNDFNLYTEGGILPKNTLSYSLGSSSNKWYYIYGRVGNFENLSITNAITADLNGKSKYLQILNLRGSYPSAVANTLSIGAAFMLNSTLGITGEDGWSDVLILRGWSDASGGKENAIIFSKGTSTVYHTLFPFGSNDSWGTPYKFLDSNNYTDYVSTVGRTGNYDDIIDAPIVGTNVDEVPTWGINARTNTGKFVYIDNNFKLNATDLPKATTSSLGAVKAYHSIPSGGAGYASLGVDSNGYIGVPIATSSTGGVVKPDGTTITINNGVISANSGGGEVNVIEVVKRNGSVLPISNKAVNVIVPTLPSDINAQPLIDSANKLAGNLISGSVASANSATDWSDCPDWIRSSMSSKPSYTLDEVGDGSVRIWGGKQDTLVSGTNIKTINNQSLLGSGDIQIQSGGTITGVSINGSSIATSGVADIPLASSSANGAMSITDKVKLDKVAVYSDITVLALINQTLTTALVHNLYTYINNNEVGLFIDSGANSYVSVNVDASSNPTAILSFLFNNKVYLATLTSSDTLELTVTDLSKMPYVPISTLPIQVGTYNLSLMDSYGLTTTVIGDMMNGTITRVKIGTDIWEVFGCANYGSTDKHFHFRFYDYHGFTQFLDISYNGSNYIVDYREVIG